MSAKEASLSSSESVLLKGLIGVGLAIFALYKFSIWQQLLSEAKQAEEAQPQAVATQPSSTPPTATSVSTTPSTAPSSVTTPANTVTSASSTQPATPSASSTETAPSETLVTSTTSATDATSTEASMPSTVAASIMPAESTPEITDTTLIQNLNQQLYDKVDKAWQAMPTFSQDLVYQVVVQEDGDIVEYDPLNPAAANFLKDVPIDELSDEQAATSSESVAKFLVVMTPNGKLEVSPWAGKN